MTSSKRPETWVPTLTITRSGFRIVLTSPGASVVEYEVGTKDLVRFYYSLRQVLSGSSAKTRETAKPRELTYDNSHETLSS